MPLNTLEQPNACCRIFSGTNVTLSGLGFSRCRNASAVRIDGKRGDPGRTGTDSGDFQSDAGNQREEERTGKFFC